MHFLTYLRVLLGQPPKLTCPNIIWQAGVNELKMRANGQRESGAFLLGQKQGKTRVIKEFLFYDDIDPTCFKNGIVEFDGRKFGAVWQHCKDKKLEVIADIHVHPGGYGQSSSDQHNPMIAEVGHMALILPDFAAKGTTPGIIGIYEYLGSRQWQDYSPLGKKALHLGWWL